MEQFFNPTEYDALIGHTFKETKLNNENYFNNVPKEDLENLRENLLEKVNELLILYYLTCDAIKTQEIADKKLSRSLGGTTNDK